MTFLSTFALGWLHKDRFEYETGSNSFSFKNGKFYSYNIVMAYIIGEILYINPLSRKYGIVYSNTTSRQLRTLIETAEKYDVNYEIVSVDDYIEEVK